MANVEEIRQGVHMRHAYLLLIQGVPFAFCDEPEIADGTGWWTADERRLLPGLTVPQGLKISLDLESGMLEEDQAVFRLLDGDGTIPQFFGGLQKTYSLLGERITPLQAPAPGGPIDAYGSPLDLTEGFLGLEAIGPALERDYYSATPHWPMPGQDHPAFDDPLTVFTGPSTGPYLIEGRRVALYRLVYDESTSSWPSFLTQAPTGLLWWGTLRQAGKVEGSIWSISCTGPGSWIRRALNSRTTSKWYPVTADFVLEDNEDHIGIELSKRYYKTGAWTLCGSDYTTYTADPSSKDNLVASIVAAINGTVGDAGPDGTWNAHAGIGAGVISFTADGVTISSTEVGGFYAMYAKIILSRKCWRALGYDPDAGIGNEEGPQPRFSGPSFAFIGANPDIIVDPPPTYHTAIFTTVPFGQDSIGFSGQLDWAGTNAPKIYTPLYEGGVSVLNGAGGQAVHITSEDNEAIYCESQIVRAPESSAEINWVPCTASRLWAFRGKIQLPQQPGEKEQPEPEDTIQVALCSWVEAESGVVAPDETGISRGLYVQRWLDPRLFGFNYEPIDPELGWASNDGGDRIEASPLALLGAYHERPDQVSHTILRTLLSTGSALWDPGIYDTEDGGAADLAGASFIQGSNTIGQAWPCGDFGIFDLGLQIPASMVDHDSILNAAEDLPGGSSGGLAQGKVSIQGGPLLAEELWKALFSPRGWSWQLKRGKYGIWAPHLSAEAAFQEGVDFEILESDLHGTPGDPASTIPEVELRPVDPYERLNFTHTGLPSEDWTQGQVELKYRARDLGARARGGARTRDVAAPDQVATQWFVGADTTNPNTADVDEIKDWSGAIAALWEKDIPAWLAQPHRLISGLRISRPKGQFIYPGAILKLTNPWPANSTGSYGLVGVYCRVLSVLHETDSCAAVVDCLAYAAPPNAVKWAPIFRVVDDVVVREERYDPANRIFHVQDWGGALPPLSALIKPADLDVVDAPAKLIGLQYDGFTWSQNFSFLVESVDLAAKSITHTEKSFVGTWFERQYTILCLAPSSDAEQADWVRAIYAQHTGLPPTVTPKLPK